MKNCGNFNVLYSEICMTFGWGITVRSEVSDRMSEFT
jgi:hypothetical protein